jgi:hypothetical protein
MTQEDRKLLLIDLSARLSYGVICKVSKGNGHLCSINHTIFGVEYGININATERDYFNDTEEIIKPYLRPMSSMTLEELEEYRRFGDYIRDAECKIHIANYEQIHWLNAHYFDYRGLIEKGLVLEAPEDMYI